MCINLIFFNDYGKIIEHFSKFKIWNTFFHSFDQIIDFYISELGDTPLDEFALTTSTSK